MILLLSGLSAEFGAPDHSRSLPEIIEAANSDDWRSNNRNNEITEGDKGNDEIPSSRRVIYSIGL